MSQISQRAMEPRAVLPAAPEGSVEGPGHQLVVGVRCALHRAVEDDRHGPPANSVREERQATAVAAVAQHSNAVQPARLRKQCRMSNLALSAADTRARTPGCTARFSRRRPESRPERTRRPDAAGRALYMRLRRGDVQRRGDAAHVLHQVVATPADAEARPRLVLPRGKLEHHVIDLPAV
eukprot:gene6510-biopygen4540